MRQKFYRCFPPRHILASAIKTLYDKEEDVEEAPSNCNRSENFKLTKNIRLNIKLSSPKLVESQLAKFLIKSSINSSDLINFQLGFHLGDWKKTVQLYQRTDIRGKVWGICQWSIKFSLTSIGQLLGPGGLLLTEWETGCLLSIRSLTFRRIRMERLQNMSSWGTISTQM